MIIINYIILTYVATTNRGTDKRPHANGRPRFDRGWLLRPHPSAWGAKIDSALQAENGGKENKIFAVGAHR